MTKYPLSDHPNDGKSTYGDTSTGETTRDVIGYGKSTPDPKWPKNAKVNILLFIVTLFCILYFEL